MSTSKVSLLQRGNQLLRKYGVLITFVTGAAFLWNSLWARYYQKKVAATADSVGSDLSVNGPSRVSENTVLGNNVNFNCLVVRGGGRVEIGDNFHSGPDCLILTRNHNYDNGSAIPYDETYNYSDVEIGDNVWFGARVTVLPGVKIEEGAIIQAGSTVTSDIPQGAIAGGHPARIFDRRDMSHYEHLKSQGKFH